MKHRVKIAIIAVIVSVVPLIYFSFSTRSNECDDSFYHWLEFWEENGYPDDIGNLFRDVNGEIVVSVVNPSAERIRQLKNLLCNNIMIIRAQYSRNELKQIMQEIEILMSEQNSGIYIVGLGWMYEDGQFIGFGESGKEERVLVRVNKDTFELYTTKFAKLYNERVIVSIGVPLRTLQ